MEGWLGLVMFGAVMALIFTGYPVAFSLAGVTLLFAGIGVWVGDFSFVFLGALPQRVYGVMQNFTLLAVPFFIFMGLLLERARLAEDLLHTAGLLFGSMRGGLAIAVIAVGTLLAATTGVVGATVVAMGLISLPVMLRYNYNQSLATGVIATSGTLGQIVPPSIILIVLGDQLGVSVGQLFMAALLPGVMLAVFYVIYVAVLAWARPEMAPALPPEELGVVRGWAMVRRVIGVMIPPLALIVAVLGSIFAGIATPTEAGSIGALGALLLAAANRRLSVRVLRESLYQTAQLTSMVMFILVAATAFALVFRGLDGDWIVRDLLTDLPGGQMGFVLFAMALIFFLGFFIDFFEIVFIVVPILLPAAQALDVDMLWFGILIAINLQTSYLTPPFGFALFYLRGVTPEEVPTWEIYKGVVPFILIQIVAFLILLLQPGIVNVLPDMR